MGVNTPKAAAVAAATVGFAMELHMPKGMIFIMGTWSMIVAMGMLFTTRTAGRIFKTEGAIPKLHMSVAPPNTPNPILIPLPPRRSAALHFQAA